LKHTNGQVLKTVDKAFNRLSSDLPAKEAIKELRDMGYHIERWNPATRYLEILQEVKHDTH